MTKRKLRKKAEIKPPQSPHDGIHTCSKGCKKPDCTRTLRDTIEEQDKQIEALKRDVLEKTAELRNLNEVIADLHNQADDDLDSIETERIENARLKADVERLRKGDERDMTAAYLYAAEQSKDVIARLKAKVERLTKAGDDMAVWITIIGKSLTCWQIEEWLRAKKGLPSEKEQREKQIKAAAKDGKDAQ